MTAAAVTAVTAVTAGEISVINIDRGATLLHEYLGQSKSLNMPSGTSAQRSFLFVPSNPDYLIRENVRQLLILLRSLRTAVGGEWIDKQTGQRV